MKETELHRYRVNLVRVYDGDTIIVDIDLGFGTWLRKQHLRLYGINTPEVRGPERPEGLVAKDFVVEALTDSEIVIRTFKGNAAKGKYGRWLATVFYRKPLDTDYTNLNAALVITGNADTVEY